MVLYRVLVNKVTRLHKTDASKRKFSLFLCLRLRLSCKHRCVCLFESNPSRFTSLTSCLQWAESSLATWRLSRSFWGDRTEEKRDPSETTPDQRLPRAESKRKKYNKELMLNPLGNEEIFLSNIYYYILISWFSAEHMYIKQKGTQSLTRLEHLPPTPCKIKSPSPPQPHPKLRFFQKQTNKKSLLKKKDINRINGWDLFSSSVKQKQNTNKKNRSKCELDEGLAKGQVLLL